jgi:hypothetical protein
MSVEGQPRIYVTPDATGRIFEDGLPVQSGGWSASLLPRTTDWRFDYNAALTKRAERRGVRRSIEIGVHVSGAVSAHAGLRASTGKGNHETKV